MSTLIGRGIYDAQEVARLLAVDAEQVVRWATPDARGNPAIAQPSLGRAFDFQELVSLALAQELRHRGVSDVELRRGLQLLRDEFRVTNPMAIETVLKGLATSGSAFIARSGDQWTDIGKGRQGTVEEVVSLYLRPLQFEAGVVSAWEPAPFVVLNPQIQAGAPCVAGTRIPTATLHALLEFDSLEDVADEYGLQTDAVEAADAFERRLAGGVGLAA